LPTEAEWEYACRAGTTTPFYFGKTITGKLANYYSDSTYLQERKIKSKGETTAVGIFPPNQFGLYDLHGNVMEWCLYPWGDNRKDALTDESELFFCYMLRGGFWKDLPHSCRSAACYYYTSIDFTIENIENAGFRVVCEIPKTL
jgi:formylglycine-generating enzyme required for sulfatase activity